VNLRLLPQKSVFIGVHLWLYCVVVDYR